MSRYKRLVVISDVQAPFHLPQAIALVIEYIKRFKPDILVLNGDIVDFYSASQFKKVGRGPQRLADEIAITKAEVLDPIMKVLPAGCKIVWTAGNHEHRLKASIAINAKFLEEFPGATIQEAFEMKERGIQYMDSESGNGVYNVTPHLVAMHGIYTTVYAARKYCEAVGKSVIYGHTHKEQYWRDTKALGGSSTIAIGGGCLCEDPTQFNSLARYDRGFIAGWVDTQSGMFDIGHRRIAGPNNTILFSDYGLLQARKTQKGWIVEETSEQAVAVVSKAVRKR
jgi:UDP-2,3-diacylglucosamine pyrophosphatase LpxH